MADKKISELNAAANLAGIDFAGVQGGETKKVASSLFDAKYAAKQSVTVVDGATYTLQATDYILHVTAETTITLPTAQTVEGRVIHIKDAAFDSSNDNITIVTEDTELIEGEAELIIETDGACISLYSDGTDWFIF